MAINFSQFARENVPRIKRGLGLGSLLSLGKSTFSRETSLKDFGSGMLSWLGASDYTKHPYRIPIMGARGSVAWSALGATYGLLGGPNQVIYNATAPLRFAKGVSSTLFGAVGTVGGAGFESVRSGFGSGGGLHSNRPLNSI